MAGAPVAAQSHILSTRQMFQGTRTHAGSTLLRCAFSKVQVEGKGLAGLVEAQLGQRLDKRLQCSSWSKRPLQPDQRVYAALDAAVLLLLLDSFIAVAPPQPPPHAGNEHLQQAHGCCSGHNGAAAAVVSSAETGSEHCRVYQGGGGGSNERSEGSRAQVEDQLQKYALSDAEDSQAASELADTLMRACAVNQAQCKSSNIVPLSPQITQGLQVRLRGRGQSELAALEESTSEHEASVGSTDDLERDSAAVDAACRAAAAWGTRLEVGGAPAKQRRDRKPGVKKLTAAEAPGEDFGELSPNFKSNASALRASACVGNSTQAFVVFSPAHPGSPTKPDSLLSVSRTFAMSQMV